MLKDRYEFDSQVTVGNELPTFDETAIKNEPMFFSTDAPFIIQHAGPITREFLAALPYEFRHACDLIIDTRVHMLMKGWFPAIPGYHHDDVPRGSDGQPDYDTTAYYARHATALINADVCPTEFVLGKCRMPPVPDDHVIYKHWHGVVEAKLIGVEEAARGRRKLRDTDDRVYRWSCPDRRIVLFDWQTFHQATRAVRPGWRWFGRATIDTHRKVTNEIRRQVQVYLEYPMEGW